MKKDKCPSYDQCKLLHAEDFIISAEHRQHYKSAFCTKSAAWDKCRRMQVGKKLHFCPDFVLPDSKLSTDEIIDTFDNL
jgi:hypothetical protein